MANTAKTKRPRKPSVRNIPKPEADLYEAAEALAYLATALSTARPTSAKLQGSEAFRMIIGATVAAMVPHATAMADAMRALLTEAGISSEGVVLDEG